MNTNIRKIGHVAPKRLHLRQNPSSFYPSVLTVLSQVSMYRGHLRHQASCWGNFVHTICHRYIGALFNFNCLCFPAVSCLKERFTALYMCLPYMFSDVLAWSTCTASMHSSQMRYFAYLRNARDGKLMFVHNANEMLIPESSPIPWSAAGWLSYLIGLVGRTLFLRWV